MLAPNKPPLSENCGNCKFAMPNEGTLYCMRNPPTAVTMMRINPQTKQQERETMSTFPPVNPDICWCGEFTHRIRIATSMN